MSDYFHDLSRFVQMPFRIAIFIPMLITNNQFIFVLQFVPGQIWSTDGI